MTYITEQGKLGNVKDDLEESRRKVKDLEKQLEDLEKEEKTGSRPKRPESSQTRWIRHQKSLENIVQR